MWSSLSLYINLSISVDRCARAASIPELVGMDQSQAKLWPGGWGLFGKHMSQGEEGGDAGKVLGEWQATSLPDGGHKLYVAWGGKEMCLYFTDG